MLSLRIRIHLQKKINQSCVLWVLPVWLWISPQPWVVLWMKRNPSEPKILLPRCRILPPPIWTSKYAVIFAVKKKWNPPYCQCCQCLCTVKSNKGDTQVVSHDICLTSNLFCEGWSSTLCCPCWSYLPSPQSLLSLLLDLHPQFICRLCCKMLITVSVSKRGHVFLNKIGTATTIKTSIAEVN